MNYESAVRYDSLPLPRAYFTPEGYLKDKPILTSCGIFEYTNPDGTVRRELRLPEEVFSPESLRSYVGKPIVLTHEAGLIDKSNVAENQIGTILGEGEPSGEDVKAPIIIHDTDAMRSAGLKELSLGYNLDLDETPGIWNGQRYDAVQRHITINHLALVREARAGEQARLNLDSRDQVNLLKGGKKMSKKIKRVPHADAVLSDEELEKALEEYDKRHKAEEAQTDADEDEVVEAPEEEAAPAPSDEVEDRVEAVKARRDKRDEEGDPEDTDAAMGIIAHQDEDIDTLFDIIDTLRAKLDFAKSASTEAPAAEIPPADEEEDSVDELEELKGEEPKADAEDPEGEAAVPADEAAPADEEEALDAADDEEEAPADEGEDLGPIDDEEENLDEADDPTDEEEGEDAPEADDLEMAPEDDLKGKRLNEDSVDRLVNMKIALGEIGDAIGLKGLARKPVKEAKLAIIKKVNPGLRMDGKSDTYINVAFQMARAEIKNRSRKDTGYQKRQMYNRKVTNMDSAETDSSVAARKRMIARNEGRK